LKPIGTASPQNFFEVGLFEIRIEEKHEISMISEQSEVIFTEQKMSQLV